MSSWAGVAPTLATSNRRMGHVPVALMGLAGGALCYLLAEASIPSAVTSAEEHDLWLAQRLGFILAPALALWLGWLQRSWRRALIGGGCGLLTGWLCYQLCSGAFQPILLALPILLGGVLAAFCGLHRNDWLHCLAGRLAKGLLVGLLIALVYIALLSLGALAFWPRTGNVSYTGAYIRMMWRAGPLALGVASAMLLPSIRWAAGLAASTINGASSCGVFWQTGSSATLGTGTTLAGSIVALTSITLNTCASLSGRALARNGAVTLDDNQVTVCSGGPGLPLTVVEVPTLSGRAMIALSGLLVLFGLAVMRRRATRATTAGAP
jgi:Ice-binding-like